MVEEIPHLIRDLAGRVIIMLRTKSAQLLQCQKLSAWSSLWPLGSQDLSQLDSAQPKHRLHRGVPRRPRVQTNRRQNIWLCEVVLGRPSAISASTTKTTPGQGLVKVWNSPDAQCEACPCSHPGQAKIAEGTLLGSTSTFFCAKIHFNK